MNQRREEIERVWRALLAREAPELLESGDAPTLADPNDPRFAILLASLLNTQGNETDPTLPELEGVSETLRPLLLELQAKSAEERLNRWMEQVDRGEEDEPVHLEPLPADVESELRSSLERKSLGIDDSELRELLTELLEETERIGDRPTSAPTEKEPTRSRRPRYRIPLQAAVVLFAFVGLGSLYLQFGPSPDVDPVATGYVVESPDKGTSSANGEVPLNVERLSTMAFSDEDTGLRRALPASEPPRQFQFGKSKSASAPGAPLEMVAPALKKLDVDEDVRLTALGDALEEKRPAMAKGEAAGVGAVSAFGQQNVPIKPLSEVAVGTSLTDELRARRGRHAARGVVAEQSKTAIEPLRQRELVLQAPLQIPDMRYLQDKLGHIRWKRRNLDKREAIRNADFRALQEFAIGRVPVIVCTESPYSDTRREDSPSDSPLAVHFEKNTSLEKIQQTVEANSNMRLVSQGEESVLVWAEAGESSLLEQTFEITEANVQGMEAVIQQLENAFDGKESDVLIDPGIGISLESGGDLESINRVNEHSYSLKKMRSKPVSVQDYLTHVLNDSPFTAAVRLGRASSQGERRVLDEKLPDRGNRKVKVYWIEYTTGSVHRGAAY